MGILYIALTKMDLDRPDGVCKKILAQCEVFSEIDESYVIGYDNKLTSIVTIKDEKIIKKTKIRNNRLSRRIALFNEAVYFCRSNKVSTVYIRYSTSDLWFIRMLKRIKDHGITIYVEVATYPYRKSLRGGGGKILLALDWMFSPQLKKYVTNIITLDNKDSIFGIPSIKIVNGINLSKIRKKQFSKNTDSVIRLIAVSTMTRRHGYDRVLVGLSDYLNGNFGTENSIIIDFIGEGPEYQKLIQLSEQLGISNYVRFHGFRFGKELDILYDKADLALDVFGTFREDIIQTSSLKTREYLAKGIPIISGCPIVDLPSANKYVLYLIVNNDSPVNFKDIVAFYHSIYDATSVEEVVEQVRIFAINNCDMHFTMRSFLEVMRRVIQ